MKTDEDNSNRILIVEDSLGTVEIIIDLLNKIRPDFYRVTHASDIEDAIRQLSENVVDVILLDLHLPDGVGVEAVRAVRQAAGRTPIVAITGMDDESLALACIDAGAIDYLFKNDLRTTHLRRAICYAVSQTPRRRLLEPQETLEQYRLLSSATAATTVTAALSGTGAVRERHPEIFQELVSKYLELFHLYLDQLIIQKSKPKDQMEALTTLLGDSGGGPRDLLDVHVAALDEIVHGNENDRTKSQAVEGRLLALEMMGLLVDYYRVGNRRYI